jgi:ethanolamine ammonia-lyase large subunit
LDGTCRSRTERASQAESMMDAAHRRSRADDAPGSRAFGIRSCRHVRSHDSRSAVVFPRLVDVLAKASPLRSGDCLAGVAAGSATERVAAQMALADIPLRQFLNEAVIPYEADEVTRLILDSHDAEAFRAISDLTVGGLRDWLLSDAATCEVLVAVASGLTPEMVAAASKLCRLQDLMVIAAKRQVVTRFRDTIGLPGRLSTRLQPNHPTDELRGVAASVIDGLLLGSVDAVIGEKRCAFNSL